MNVKRDRGNIPYSLALRGAIIWDTRPEACTGRWRSWGRTAIEHAKLHPGSCYRVEEVSEERSGECNSNLPESVPSHGGLQLLETLFSIPL